MRLERRGFRVDHHPFLFGQAVAERHRAAQVLTSFGLAALGTGHALGEVAAVLRCLSAGEPHQHLVAQVLIVGHRADRNADALQVVVQGAQGSSLLESAAAAREPGRGVRPQLGLSVLPRSGGDGRDGSLELRAAVALRARVAGVRARPSDLERAALVLLGDAGAHLRDLRLDALLIAAVVFVMLGPLPRQGRIDDYRHGLLAHRPVCRSEVVQAAVLEPRPWGPPLKGAPPRERGIDSTGSWLRIKIITPSPPRPRWWDEVRHRAWSAPAC
jgi:hypothetical protein